MRTANVSKFFVVHVPVTRIATHPNAPRRLSIWSPVRPCPLSFQKTRRTSTPRIDHPNRRRMSRLRPFTYAASGPGQAQVQQLAPAQTQSKQIQALERDTDPSACALVNFIAKESIDASSQVRKDGGSRGGGDRAWTRQASVRVPTHLLTRPLTRPRTRSVSA